MLVQQRPGYSGCRTIRFVQNILYKLLFYKWYCLFPFILWCNPVPGVLCVGWGSKLLQNAAIPSENDIWTISSSQLCYRTKLWFNKNLFHINLFRTPYQLLSTFIPGLQGYHYHYHEVHFIKYTSRKIVVKNKVVKVSSKTKLKTIFTAINCTDVQH